MNKFISTPIGLISTCLAFVLIGLFMVLAPNTEMHVTIAGYANIALFGLGTLVGIVRLMDERRQRTQSTTDASHDQLTLATEQTAIETKKLVPQDDEILEEWIRVGDALDEQLQGVSAIKTMDDNYAWSIFLSLPEYLGNGPDLELLSGGVIQAVSKIEGVKAVFHEDREKWIIDGTCEPKSLIIAAALANDAFLKDWKVR